MKKVTETKSKPLFSEVRTPNEKRLKYLKIWKWVFCILFIILFVAVIVYSIKDNEKTYELFPPQIIASVLSLLMACFTFLLNSNEKVKAIVSEEKSLINLYRSEFHDLKRHIEANLKVLIQIKMKTEDMSEKKGGKAEPIHFDNLSWPEKSILFSDDVAKIMNGDDGTGNFSDVFSRLRVNIRNINNSAAWLSRERPCGKKLREDVEWEITRHFGFLLNLDYLEKNNFQWAELKNLEPFYNGNEAFDKNKWENYEKRGRKRSVPNKAFDKNKWENYEKRGRKRSVPIKAFDKNKWENYFIGYPEEKREELAKNYKDRYFEDRIKRVVLVRE